MKVTVLSSGPFHEQLHFAVLVGRSQRGERCRAGAVVARLPVLAEALRPELHEPVGDVPQRIGVRHQHVDVPAGRRVGQELERGEETRRVRRQRIAGATRGDVARSGEKLRRVHPRQRRRKNSNRREHAVASADGRRNVERRDPLAVGDLAERAVLWIGHEDEVSSSRRAFPCSVGRGRRGTAPSSPPFHRISRSRRTARARATGDRGAP